MSMAIALPANAHGISLPDERQLYSEDLAGDRPASSKWEYKNPTGKISSMLGILAKYLGSEVLKKVPRMEGEGPFAALVNTFVGETQNMLYNKAMTDVGNKFPTLAHQIAWWEGSSNIEAYYTARVDGKELPLHLQGRGEQDVDAQILLQHYEQVTKDPLKFSGALNGKLLQLFNRKWSTFYKADNRYMNGDMKDVEQYDKFWEGFSKLDLYHVYQGGKKISIGEFTDSQGKKVELLKYKRPPRLSTYLYNWWGNLEYDIKDIIFYNAVRLFGPVAKHAFVEAEWKNHVKAYKGRANPTSMYGGHFT